MNTCAHESDDELLDGELFTVSSTVDFCTADKVILVLVARTFSGGNQGRQEKASSRC
jgi:hypothetical protein